MMLPSSTASTSSGVPCCWTVRARFTLGTLTLSSSAASGCVIGDGSIELSPTFCPCDRFASRAATIDRWLSSRCRRCRFSETTNATSSRSARGQRPESRREPLGGHRIAATFCQPEPAPQQHARTAFFLMLPLAQPRPAANRPPSTMRRCRREHRAAVATRGSRRGLWVVWRRHRRPWGRW